MNIEAIITMVTEFFKSIPWENVLGAFKGSIDGINWDSLAGLFDGFDLSGGTLQAIIDVVVEFFQALFGAGA